MNATKATVGLIKAVQRAWTRKWSFLGAFLVVLLVVTQIFVAIGFVPDASSSNTQEADATVKDGATVVTPATLVSTPLIASADAFRASDSSAPVGGALNMNGELPTKVMIPGIGVNTPVDDPATTNVEALDNYLSSAAVRYPTSATLDQQGNVIIFGHSSYLPVVINQHYKTFDGIQNLKAGDLIYVYSSEHKLTYSVTTERKASALTDSIPLTTTGHTLTLATCDSFTTKTDRFIVTATLVGSSALGS